MTSAIADANRRIVARLRTGVCLCGRPTAVHFSARNTFLTCDELAEHEAAIAAAADCTTFTQAEALAGARLLEEGRF